MRKIGMSIYIPYLVFLHMGTGLGITVSRRCGFGWLAHYGRKKRSMGRSEKNYMNVWGHFDPENYCMGFSKIKGPLIFHFNGDNRPTGFSVILGLVLLHFLKNEGKGKSG